MRRFLSNTVLQSLQRGGMGANDMAFGLSIQGCRQWQSSWVRNKEGFNNRGSRGGDRGGYGRNTERPSRGGGDRFVGGRGDSHSSTRPATSEGVGKPNSRGDDRLSEATLAAMRDDNMILSELFKFLPPQGAISIKSLYAQLSTHVQEALSEKHSGLGSFLQQRQQFFVVKPRPEDGVLFVAANSLAVQKFGVRELQKATMRQMMGLREEGQRGNRDGGRQGSGGRPNRGRGGGGNRGRGSGYRRDDRDRAGGAPHFNRGEYDGNKNNRVGGQRYGERDGEASRERGRGDEGRFQRQGPMGSRGRNFGAGRQSR